MAKLTLTDPSAGYNSTTVIAANNALVEAAVENTLSRDGTSPNAMAAAIDMNSNKINNLTDGTNNQDAITLAQLNAASVVASTTAASAVTVADAGANYAATTAEAAFAELASVATGEGASIIGVEDSAGNMAATNVEAALAEIYVDYVAADAVDLASLAAITNGNGASLIGLEDAAGNVAAADVEAAIAEIYVDTAKNIATTEAVTTTNVIAASESGTTFFLNAAGGFTSTLPAPAAGLQFTFIVTTAPTTAYIITTNAGANVLQGSFLDIVGELVAITAQDTLNFVANVSLPGDRLDVISDGTSWFCQAFSKADGGITVSVT